MPVSCGHEQGVSMLQDHLVSPGQFHRRIGRKVQLVGLLVEIFFKVHETQYLPGFPVKLMLLLEGEEQYAFTPYELRMHNMGEIDVEMHVGYGAFSTHKKHGIAFDKTFHQMFGPFEVLDELRGMLEDIEKENAPFRRALPHHIDIIPK